MKLLKTLWVVVFSMALVGCGSKLAVIDEPSFQADSSMTVKQIEEAILEAQKAGRGWVLKKTSDGLITGRLINGKSTVTVEIPYSEAGYTIRYVSSSDDVKAEGGRINPAYNRWVKNLNSDIRRMILLSE